MRILLVEDDELLGKGLRAGLAQQGYTVDWLRDGQAAELALLSEHFDLVVLDLGLPKRDGMDVLHNVRSKGNSTPVLILTAREGVETRVKGLDSGADDYLEKPVDLTELFARLRALQRRSAGRAVPLIQYGSLQLDPASHSVYRDETRINVSPREFALLHKLLESTGRVMSRETLSQSLYGWDTEIDSNAVEVHIHNLRKKLGTGVIETVRGVGYMIEK
jgi:two-component system, OmpR family, response regulator QseB